MKTLKLEKLELINGGDKCDKWARKYEKKEGARKEKLYLKAWANGCEWVFE